MNILITGSRGFIGKNLSVKLKELNIFRILEFNRDDSTKLLGDLIKKADLIIHLAGENRPKSKNDFTEVNIRLTEFICKKISELNKQTPIIFTSSTQAELDNPYGKSKLAAEQIIIDLKRKISNEYIIYRLPGVFGKWARPDYNSVVATFCNNIALDKPIKIDDPDKNIELIYIDDLINSLVKNISQPILESKFEDVETIYTASLKELSEKLIGFKTSRDSLAIDKVGKGFCRALYATYVSYIPKEDFSYSLNSNKDDRGNFVEMLKTSDSGQFSFFTAFPGVTRGGHYHHTKTEKFLVIKGNALFKFRNIMNNEVHSISVDGEDPKIVETIPGWSHDITNVGSNEMIVMLWANEVFDPCDPDTFSSKV